MKKNLKQVRPEDFDVEALIAAAQEGRLYVEEEINRARNKQVIEDVRANVARMLECIMRPDDVHLLIKERSEGQVIDFKKQIIACPRVFLTIKKLSKDLFFQYLFVSLQRETIIQIAMDKQSNKKKKVKKAEVVANRDQLPQVINHDLANINIESLIRTIRGQKVMVDFDLAMLYGVQNKRLNEQVKRNIERFPDDFMFQLTKEEWKILRSQIATAKTIEDKAITLLRSQFATAKDLSKIRTLPYAFTRNGIGMLSSVLGSKTAVAMNIRIMRAFTISQQIMESNAILFNRVFHLEQHQQETDEKINLLMAKMDDQSPKLLPEQIFATGCVWDAWTYVSDLVRSAKKRIVLIDNFVDDRVLSLLDKRADHVEATIYSRYYESFQTDLRKHNEQYREITFIQLPQKNHDRFLMIDDDVYLLGASIKDMGVGMCAVTKMQVSPETILQLI